VELRDRTEAREEHELEAAVRDENAAWAAIQRSIALLLFGRKTGEHATASAEIEKAKQLLAISSAEFDAIKERGAEQ
jgi:hypothetical protein